MTAQAPSDFPYELRSEEDRPEVLRKYWGIAQGLQKVDDLQTSSRLEQLSRENIEGLRSLKETGELLKAYYEESSNMALDDDLLARANAEREADFVSLRIAELLAKGAFLFSPIMLDQIHGYLFQDLDAQIYRPGEHKDQPLQKQELILNGDSVVYADPSLVDASLKLAFEDEAGHSYGRTIEGKDLEGLAQFVSRMWQAHPFFEGNTRAIAVFLVLYLNDLGYEVTNEPFEEHSCFFRNALVRANYRNPKAGVFPDLSYVVSFLQQALSGSEKALHSRDLMVQALFDDPSLLRNVSPRRALRILSEQGA